MHLDKWLRSQITIPLWLWRKGKYYFSELNDIRSLHKRSIENIHVYQFKMLKKLIGHAYTNVPFYREEWKKADIHPQDINSLEDFNNLPVLTKKQIRENPDRFLSEKSNKTHLIQSGTGGTTDSPIILYYDHKRDKFKAAEMHYFREWFYWYLGDKVSYLWGAPQDIPNIDIFKYRLRNRLTFNKHHMFSSMMDNPTMEKFVNEINTFEPDILQAYSNPAHILASFILENDIQIHSPKSVVLTAEPCLPSQRKIIEKAFKCEVYTFYGCREGGYVGCECAEHDGYHINCSSIYMEFLTAHGPAESNQLGSIVFTDLYNYDMPFIRYQIGDVGIPQATPCSCGSSLPKMKFFAGRETDVFVLPDGSYVPGVSLCDRIIEDCVGIEQLQFIQNKIDELNVKIVKGPQFSSNDTLQLDKRLEIYFQNKLKINKVFVDDIPKEKSGKTRFCISNVNKEI